MTRHMTRRRLVTILASLLLVVGVGASPAGAASGVDAKAKFKVTLGAETDTFTFGQSTIVESTLDGTDSVPVSLHAASKADPFDEFVLAGQLEKGVQRTSETLALGLNVSVGDQSMLLNSTDGGCTVKVKKLSGSRIAGTFTCDTTYGGDPLTAKGSFSAR